MTVVCGLSVEETTGAQTWRAPDEVTKRYRRQRNRHRSRPPRPTPRLWPRQPRTRRRARVPQPDPLTAADRREPHGGRLSAVSPHGVCSYSDFKIKFGYTRWAPFGGARGRKAGWRIDHWLTSKDNRSPGQEPQIHPTPWAATTAPSASKSSNSNCRRARPRQRLVPPLLPPTSSRPTSIEPTPKALLRPIMSRL
jgi:hypothetical protein